MQCLDCSTFFYYQSLSLAVRMWKRFLQFSRSDVTKEACKWWFHLYGICRDHAGDTGKHSKRLSFVCTSIKSILCRSWWLHYLSSEVHGNLNTRGVCHPTQVCGGFPCGHEWKGYMTSRQMWYFLYHATMQGFLLLATVLGILWCTMGSSGMRLRRPFRVSWHQWRRSSKWGEKWNLSYRANVVCCRIHCSSCAGMMATTGRLKLPLRRATELFSSSSLNTKWVWSSHKALARGQMSLNFCIRESLNNLCNLCWPTRVCHQREETRSLMYRVLLCLVWGNYFRASAPAFTQK